MADSSPQRIYKELDPDKLRDALRFWTTGVTIVSATHDGVMHGMTANSFTSLSLEPPLVMVSLEKSTRTQELVRQSGFYAVTVLNAAQQSLSDRFAGRDTEQSNRFEGVKHFELQSGSPIVYGGLAFFDCKVESTLDAGTHTIYVGRVLEAGVSAPDGHPAPLVYFNRAYRRLSNP